MAFQMALILHTLPITIQVRLHIRVQRREALTHVLSVSLTSHCMIVVSFPRQFALTPIGAILSPKSGISCPTSGVPHFSSSHNTSCSFWLQPLLHNFLQWSPYLTSMRPSQRWVPLSSLTWSEKETPTSYHETTNPWICEFNFCDRVRVRITSDFSTV